MSVPITGTLTFWEACLPSNHQVRPGDQYHVQQAQRIISVVYVTPK